MILFGGISTRGSGQIMKRLMGWILLACGALVFAGFPASVRFQQIGQLRALEWAEILAFLAFGALAVAALVLTPSRERVLRALSRLSVESAPPLWAALAVGALIRVVTILVVAPLPASDGASYLALANRLAETGQYGDHLARAYWPPGLALFLAPLLTVMTDAWALVVLTLLCFVSAAVGLHRLASALNCGPWAVWIVWLFAIWPNHILMSGLPEKELLVIAAIPWMLVFAKRSLAHVAWAFPAGLLLGAAVLVQPSLQLLPFFAVVVALFWGAPWRRLLVALAVGVTGSIVVVAPWSVRNYMVFDKFVMVSTNGGSNLYRANNDMATGGYMIRGTVDVDALGELSADREGKRLAREWMISNPVRFFELCAGRALLFSGDHSYGVYAAFRAQPDRLPRMFYLLLKLGSAVTWLVLWAVICSVTANTLRTGRDLPLGVGWTLLPWAYLLSIHSIFESGIKYHLPAMVAILALVAMLMHAQQSDPGEVM